MSYLDVFYAIRPYLKYVGILAALGVAFAFGRFGTAEHIRTETVEKIVFKDRVVEKAVEKIVYVDRTKTKTSKTSATVRLPDGTITETVKETTDTATAIDLDAHKTIYVDRVVEVATDRKDTAERDTPMPDWRVSILSGVNIPAINTATGPALNQLVIGGSVERRIVGPLHAGVWGVSTGAVGLLVGVEF